MTQSQVDAMNNFINGEINNKKEPLCTLSTMELEKDTTVCATGLVKDAITRLNASTEMLADDIKQADYEPVPTTKPPGVVKREIQDKGKLLLQVLWILIQLVPAILYAIYVKVFPPKGKSLRGKVALVTGAGRGLGRGLAIALSREGCKLACADIDMVGCEETVRMIGEEGGVAKAYRANVAKPNEIEAMRRKIEAELGPVVYVVNNASLIVSHRIDDENQDADRAVTGVINVNLLSHFYMSRAFLPSMRKNKDGHIVAIASMSSFAGLAYSSVYAACKWAVRGMMESMREELKREGEKNVKLTCVHPYFINTSAEYTNNWNIRFPELTIEEVVDATINGIKQDHFSVSIPEDMYYNIHVMKLLPRFIQDQLLDVFYAKINVLSKNEVEKTAANHIINKSLDNSSL
ncbi:17-beta-hydroxysteroid dehydrogenase 13 [Nilaparvata lugens]|uniref:17-beta-hydroxysteroid dehydrogenase 13 n=1 Tax=Nilaparvata lugens TaxID=108931 RepID=UPI00193CDC32|nr:17-beta-hydroxysteroid dehydrogenase 13 [Nilaparvata lugens]